MRRLEEYSIHLSKVAEKLKVSEQIETAQAFKMQDGMSVEKAAEAQKVKINPDLMHV
ncbi:hypothetical protein CLV84_2740 [Neolewinella xylanilytica]|uniref:Uncharacterized protein n=2 Tax=Neolewinella xylanilytica TaxID=1514080 RepID=A0A2S6I3U0_9BACT|nr:hypothetical protein CLV84_2740 [Neolewinella xylanilytica]